MLLQMLPKRLKPKAEVIRRRVRPVGIQAHQLARDDLPRPQRLESLLPRPRADAKLLAQDLAELRDDLAQGEHLAGDVQLPPAACEDGGRGDGCGGYAPDVVDVDLAEGEGWGERGVEDALFDYWGEV